MRENLHVGGLPCIFFFKKKNKVTHVGRLSSFTHTNRIPAIKHVCLFFDNDAVIKKIIKGRSTDDQTCFRQTHRVARNWVCDRINLGPGIPNQACRHRQANRRHPKKRCVTRDKWDRLLRLFNVKDQTNLDQRKQTATMKTMLREHP